MGLRITYDTWVTAIRLSGLVLCMLIFMHVNSICQSRFSNDLYFTASYRPGFMMPEYSFINYLVDDYIHSFEISILKQTTGENEWHQIYHYPEYGLALQYSSLGNTRILGREISLYPFFRIHIFDAGKFSLINQTGLGIGFVNKKYDTEDNPLNVAIGSNINLHFNFELNAQFQVQQKLFLYTGLCIDHLSNGNLSEPNLGLNYMTFNAGAVCLVGEKSERTHHELAKHIPTTQAALIFSVGKKHARSLQDRSYFISSLSFELKRKFWRVFYPGIGADIFYDAATQAEVFAFSDNVYHRIDDFKTGIHLQGEFVYNKFSLSIQEGYYVGLTDKAFDNATYSRFIIRHRVGDRLFVQLALKAHVIVLDFIEFGVGYTGKS